MSAITRIVACLLIVGAAAISLPATTFAVSSYGYMVQPYGSASSGWTDGLRVGIRPQGAYPGHPYGIAGSGEINYWFSQQGDGSDTHISAGFMSTGAGAGTACGTAGSPSRFMEWRTLYDVDGCLLGSAGIAMVEETFKQFCNAGDGSTQDGHWWDYSAGWPYLLGPLYIGPGVLWRSFLGGQTISGGPAAPHLTDASSYQSYNQPFNTYNACAEQGPWKYQDADYAGLNIEGYVRNSGWLVPQFRSSGWQVGVHAY